MSVRLSEADLTQLEAALTLLLSPAQYERVTDWRRACRKQIEQLLRADRSTFGLFLDQEPVGEQDSDLDSAIAAYLAHYHQFDLGFRDRRRELGLELYTRSMLYGPEHVRSEFYNDWIVPYRVDDGLGIGIGESPTGLPAAFINFYHATESRQRFGKRDVTLLRLLLPAFKAGIHTCRTFARHRDRWGQVLDSLGQAALVTSGRGTAHQTPALRELLGRDGEHATLLRAVNSMAQALASLGGLSAKGAVDCPPNAVLRDVTTPQARYRLRGSYLPNEPDSPVIVVTVDRLTPIPTSDAELLSRFGLTRREVDVARQLAEGRTNTALAAALGISPHTAERHTERVLDKLGLHSRAGVGAVLARG